MKAKHMLLSFVPALVLVSGLGACDEANRAERTSAQEGTDDIGEEEPVEVDAAAIIADAMAYEDRLIRLSDDLETSETHSDAASVFVWGSQEAANTFRGIDPDDPTQAITFPENTMFIKEHFDENGDKVGLTVMSKGPAGYNEDSRDWFWARIRDAEVTHQGRVDWCSDCHNAAHNSDFVVGFGKSP